MTEFKDRVIKKPDGTIIGIAKIGNIESWCQSHMEGGTLHIKRLFTVYTNEGKPND